MKLTVSRTLVGTVNVPDNATGTDTQKYLESPYNIINLLQRLKTFLDDSDESIEIKKVIDSFDEVDVYCEEAFSILL